MKSTDNEGLELHKSLDLIGSRDLIKPMTHLIVASYKSRDLNESRDFIEFVDFVQSRSSSESHHLIESCDLIKCATRLSVAT